MKSAFFPVPGTAIGHIVLLELIRLSHLDSNQFDHVTLDYKVSCETSGSEDNEAVKDLPCVIQKVLADARVGALADVLIASGALRVLVDLDVLQRRCELIARQWHDERLLRAFVQAKASTPMIRSFFRTATRATIVRLRREMNVPPPVKPRMPTSREIDALVSRWYDMRDIADVRSRYLALHRECDGAWSLASLFAALDSATNPDATSSVRICPSTNSRESYHVRHAP
ncbi:hypothetical protein [Paraburkholderia silvatlantica]|uniref:hypothetical protein n=1 Tax=Paraburkholderia silvatlantica TaxID=321895 RepID=UPI0037524F91